MSFYKRYELDRLIADGDAKTFRAVENATGRIVLLHMFNPKGQAVLAVLKSKLARDPARLSPPLLEMGEFAGSPYAVTEDVPGFKDLREWLAQVPITPVAMPSTPSAAPPAPAPPRASQLRAPSRPGSTTERFNRLFDAPNPTPPPPPAPAPSKSQANQAKEAGEFTRIFGGPPSPPPPPSAPEPSEFTRMFGGQAPPGPPPTTSSPPRTDTGPGEFTRIFKLQEQGGGSRPSSPPPPPPPAAPPKGDDFDKMFGPTPSAGPAPIESHDRGEFGGLFGMGPVGESINIEEEQARAARSAAPEARPFQAPSEFTRVFGPEHGAKSPRPPAATRTVRSASGLFGDPKDIAAQRGRSRTQTGPGEYTRIIGARKTDQPEPKNVMPAAAPKRSWVLWVAIGVPVLALVVFAIIALVMRSR